jgi:dinuclear metal center YbgI/SA1388 family protein
MERSALTAYMDEYLRLSEIRDYGPQGLQIEGTAEVRRIVATVDSGPPCIAAAIERGADMLLVHHGIFWGETKRIAGSFGRLVRRCLEADLNLYAAHLALDAHPEVGNNAVLAERLGLEVKGWWGEYKGTPIAALAEASPGTTLDTFAGAIEQWVGAPVLIQAKGPSQVRRVGICSGGAAEMAAEAAALGCDTFLTGEPSQSHFYIAEAEGINVIYGGHYSTETVGVQALGEHVALKFGLDFEFVDLPTGL